MKPDTALFVREIVITTVEGKMYANLICRKNNGRRK